MIRYLLILSLFYTSTKAQVSLNIQYVGDDESTSIDLYQYVDFIVPTSEKIETDFALIRNKGESLSLSIDKPVLLLISNQSFSKEFFVQPDNAYSVNISDNNISIQSSDNINKAILKLDSAIEKYYSDLFELTDSDPEVNQNQIYELLSDLENFGNQWKGTDFQKQVIKYKLAYAKNVTFGLHKEKEKYYQLENTYLLECEIQLNNPAYIEFLYDHYFRRIRQVDLLKTDYTDEQPLFDIIKHEVATIPNPAIQQIALLKLANESFNTTWVNNNDEIIQLFDSLSISGVNKQIKNAAAEFLSRISSLQPGVKIPNFRFLDIDGNEVKISQFSGKYILLDFWFVGCRPCEIAVPYKTKLYERFGNEFEILSINSKNSISEISNYKIKKGHLWTFLKASKNDISLSALNIQSYPTYYLLDQEGRIILSPKKNDSIKVIFADIERVLSESCK